MAHTAKLPLVQVLRAFAAGLIVVHHAQNDAAILAARTGATFAPSTLLPWAAGVDVFFVISGFVVVHAAGSLFGRRGAWRTFLAHRAARIVPLYWIVTTLYLAVALAAPGRLSGAHAEAGPGYVLASYLFWPARAPDGSFQPLYSLGWTLNYEAFFYALLAALLVLPRRGAVAALCGVLALAVLAGMALPSDAPAPVIVWTHPIVLEFALGALLALARAEGVRLAAGTRLVLAACGLTGLALAGAAAEEMRLIAYGGPAALLVAAAALAPAPAGSGSRLVGAAVALGDASYALYLIHPFAIRAAREAALGLVPGLPPVAFVLAAAALSVAAALVVHRAVERPLVRGGRALLEPAGPAPRAAAPEAP